MFLHPLHVGLEQAPYNRSSFHPRHCIGYCTVHYNCSLDHRVHNCCLYEKTGCVAMFLHPLHVGLRQAPYNRSSFHPRHCIGYCTNTTSFIRVWPPSSQFVVGKRKLAVLITMLLLPSQVGCNKHRNPCSSSNPRDCTGHYTNTTQLIRTVR